MQQSKPKDFQIRATSRVRRLVPKSLDDLGVQPAVVGLGRHLQTKTFRASTSPNSLQMFGWSRTNLSMIIVLPMSLSP